MKKYRKILAIILSIISIICFAAAIIYITNSNIKDRQYAARMESLRPTASPAASVSPTPAPKDNPVPKDTPLPEPSNKAEMSQEPAAVDMPTATPTPKPTATPAVANPYRNSFLANSDMAAWLQIPGTNVDYPVMWTPRDENYYLYRDFDGNENQNGCLILDTDSSLNPLTTNLIIHGHNMRSGAMFGNLTDYEDEEYFESHREIILYTRECQRNYEVIAVFRSQVYKKSDEVFKFYKFFQADTEEEFNDFYDNIKELSIYDTGVTAEFGDHLLTLSTCVYHVDQGRFVVVAKEVTPGDSYLPITE